MLILSWIETRRRYQKVRRAHLRVFRREIKSTLLVRPTTLIFHFATLEEKESRDIADLKPAGESRTFVHIYLRDFHILALFFRDCATMLESPVHSNPLV